MASRLLLGRIQSACRLPGGHRGQRLLRRPPPPAGDRSVCSNAYGREIKTGTRVTEHEPHLDRFSDPRVAHEHQQFVQFLDKMLDALRNPQSLAQLQRRRLESGRLKVLDDDI